MAANPATCATCSHTLPVLVSQAPGVTLLAAVQVVCDINPCRFVKFSSGACVNRGTTYECDCDDNGAFEHLEWDSHKNLCAGETT